MKNDETHHLSLFLGLFFPPLLIYYFSHQATRSKKRINLAQAYLTVIISGYTFGFLLFFTLGVVPKITKTINDYDHPSIAARKKACLETVNCHWRSWQQDCKCQG